jgi:hypothetical protein
VLVVLAALVAIFAPALKEDRPAAPETATPDGHPFPEGVPKTARETTPSPK